jgi:branched-chain amino acid transport system substrate-binding protein
VRRSLFFSMVMMFVSLVLVANLCAESNEYRVGCAFAVTGAASWLGEPQKNTVEMLAREINDAGGINGKKLVLYIEDTQGDNTRAVNAVKKLIQKNKVSVIIGPSRSGTAMAAIPVAEAAGIPMISCASAEIQLQPIEQRKNIFKVAPNDSDAIRRIYDHMVPRDIKKIGIITSTDGFGAAGRTLMLEMAPEYKIEIVADETYSPADTDMTAQLINIRNKGAEAILNWSIVPAQSIVPQNIRQLKIDIPFYQSHGFCNVKYAAAAGTSAEGNIFPCGRILAVDTLPDDNLQKPVLLDYKTKYEEKYKDHVSTFGGHAYDALMLVVDALRAAGDDPQKIRDYLETARFIGTGGIFQFSPTDHCGLDKTAFEMLTVKDGKFVVLEQ